LHTFLSLSTTTPLTAIARQEANSRTQQMERTKQPVKKEE